VPIDSPIRELIFELTRIFELAAGCLAPVKGFAFLVLMITLLRGLDLVVTLFAGCLVFTEIDRTVLLLFEIEVRLFELVLGLAVTVRTELEEVLVLLRFTVVVPGLLRTVIVVILDELLRLGEAEFLELAFDWDCTVRFLETVLLRLRLVLDGL